MSGRLMKALETSRREIESGLVEAEKELAELRAHCRALEELVALGKATLPAAQMSGDHPPATAPPPAQAAAPARGVPAPAPPENARSAPKTNREAAGNSAAGKATVPSLAERAAALRAALDTK